MNNTMTFTGTLVITDCWCGIRYAIPQTLHDYVFRQKIDGRKQTNIYCPLGHAWTFAGEAEVDKERRRIERLQREVANANEDARAARASLIATKAVLTKERNRAARGMCPHPDCHRSFVDVAKHVATKHPEMVTP